MEPPNIKIKNRPLYPLGPCQGDGYGVRQLQILIWTWVRSCMNLFIANCFCAIVYLQIACGMDHTLLLSYEGEVFTCGWGADGQTG